jgi:hypothetical protein
MIETHQRSSRNDPIVALLRAESPLGVNYGDPALIGGRQLHPSKLPAPRLHRSFGQAKPDGQDSGCRTAQFDPFPDTQSSRWECLSLPRSRRGCAPLL